MSWSVVLWCPSEREIYQLQRAVAEQAIIDEIIVLTEKYESYNGFGAKVRFLHCPYFISTKNIQKIIELINSEFILIVKEKGLFVPLNNMLKRLEQIFKNTNASLLYSYFTLEQNGTNHNIVLPPFQKGSARDTFPMGPAIALHVDKTKLALRKFYPLQKGKYSGLFQIILCLAIDKNIVLLVPEILYLFNPHEAVSAQQKHFKYVMEKDEVRKEKEDAFKNYLKMINAYVDTPSHSLPAESEDFPVEASIIIPVKNRAETIKDSVDSALSQKANFDFNVLVVDNYSTDGTSSILKELHNKHSNLYVLSPKNKGLGIGGCWQLAIESKHCGRYALQLDSDDLYSFTNSLKTMVDAIKSGPFAMAVGTYKVTNSRLEETPTGIIDHKEWSRENGHNNLLRVEGIGAPRCYYVPALRKIGFPNVSYGEDYAVALEMSRRWPVVRVWDVVYLCRRWEGNSDSSVTPEVFAMHHMYKDFLRSCEITKRQLLNE